MLDFFRTHAKKFQWVLFPLLLLGLGFVGIQGFSRFWDASNTAVAKVDGHSITQAEWDQAHQRQVERLRQQMPNIDVKLLDTPEAKREVLDQLLRERTILAAVNRQHLAITDDRLVQELSTSPELASLKGADGRVDKAKYKQLLASQGMSAEMFEAQVRQQLAMRQVLAGVSGTAFAGNTASNGALDAMLQRREISLQRFDTKDYSAKVNPTDADLEAFYKAHEGEFRTTEQASIEYVVLELEVLKKSIAVSEDTLKTYYEQNSKRFTAAEERRARHILVKADKDASADAKAKAKAKAEALLAEVKKNPASFSEVARKNSEDTGSAERGGDLDFFGRGMMVPPFEQAAFGLKTGEISGVVESDFGFHIIIVDAVRGGAAKPFAEVRAEIEDELRKQEAGKKWAESAEAFTNTVYEQPDSLQPVIDKFKLDKRSATVGRTPAPGASGALGSAKLLDAVFANDALQNKRNTSAVEVGPNQLAAARVLKHDPARVRPLAEVRDAVRARVVAQQAAALAKKEGAERLAQLKKEPKAELGSKLTVSRMKPEGLSRDALESILRADASQLPAFVGVDMGDQGYLAVRVEQVLARDAAADEGKRLTAQVGQAWGNAETQAYLDALKSRFKAEIKAAATAAAAASAAAK